MGARQKGGCRGAESEFQSSHDYLHHVKQVFRRLGYSVAETEEPPPAWAVLWSHEYPFSSLRAVIGDLNPQQLVNHIPGSSFYTMKVG